MKTITLFMAFIAMCAFTTAEALIYRQVKAQNAPTTLQSEPEFHMYENVVEIISNDPNTETFMKALQAGRLDTVLEGPGPFTIFAPSNEAFNKLGDEKLNELLKPENKKALRKILLYHIVPGKILSTDLQTISVPTAIGKDLKIQVSGSEIKVNDAEVIGTDIEGTNGVIHIIDEVLIP